MRHEISAKEASAIYRARAKNADKREQERKREQEQRDLDALELRYKTQ